MSQSGELVCSTSIWVRIAGMSENMLPYISQLAHVVLVPIAILLWVRTSSVEVHGPPSMSQGYARGAAKYLHNDSYANLNRVKATGFLDSLVWMWHKWTYLLACLKARWSPDIKHRSQSSVCMMYRFSRCAQTWQHVQHAARHTNDRQTISFYTQY